MVAEVHEGAAVQELSPDEAEALFDRQARYYLDMSGAEFVRKWHAGDFANEPEDRRVMLVASLLPFAPSFSPARAGLLGRITRHLRGR